MVYLCSNTYNVPTAVSFQFSLIGNDPRAAKLLEELDQDPDIGEHNDILPVEFDLEHQMEDKWFVVCHVLFFRRLIN